MNKHVVDLAAPKVTTGPLPASRKVYSMPDGAPDLRLPLREIVLSEASGEAPLPVYDTSGPYTDPAVRIEVTEGLARLREAWVRERNGVEAYEGRAVRPEDNGNAGTRLARAFDRAHRPLRGTGERPLTQLEWARARGITKDTIYIAEREKPGRKAMPARAGRALAD